MANSLQSPDLLIIGASVRAAAHSAIRAGYRPMCADLFADRDLLAVAPCLHVAMDDYPQGLAAAFEEYPDVSWMYTGGLENYPEFIEHWAKRRILYGTQAKKLSTVRNPEKLGSTLQRHGVTFPSSGQTVESKRCLVKPLRSAGGRGIREWKGETIAEGEYLQDFVDGQAVSAVFVTGGGHTFLIGTTTQLIGQTWLNAPPFQYCGSIGPIEYSPIWEGVKQTLNEVGLSGVIGVDAILNDGKLTVIEVNPRYTASVEVLEHVTGKRLIEQHVFCFGHLVETPPITGTRPACVGKAVYFAPSAFVFPEQRPWDDDLRKPFDPWRLPVYADIPAAGTQFQRGDPVLSIFVQGASPSDCLDLLQASARQLRLLLPL